MKLLAAFLVAMLVPAAVVTARGSWEHGSTPCNVMSTMDSAEIQITGPKVHGCDTNIEKQIRDWQFLGFLWSSSGYGPPPTLGAPAPAGTPVCTVASRDQTWRFYDAGRKGAAARYCQLLKNKTMLHLWQTVQQD